MNINNGIEEITSPEYISEKYTLDEFYWWCRNPYLKLEGSSKIFDFHLKRFEEAELYEYCAILKTAKEEFENGTIKFLEE
jgi:hypothetical protein